MNKPIIFTDFDGTITTEDTLTGAILPYVDREEFLKYNGKLERGEMTLDDMEKRGIPVVVISGGFRQFSERKLAPYMKKITALHAVDMMVDGDKLKLVSGYDDGNELLKKTDVMALYDYDFAIGIGDSYTDKNMARAVDVCFARDVLAAYLDKTDTPYTAYDDFNDVMKEMDRILEGRR